MKISIAMTTYNGSKYLQEQLHGFLLQTRKPDELVVCDDCSTDNTKELLMGFQKSAPFAVRIYSNKENLGYNKNFEKALSLCSGDLVFLSDQDDVWLENKLFSVEAAFNENPDIMLIINDSYVSDEHCNERSSSKLANIKFNGISEDAYIAGCATAVRADFLKLVLPFPDYPGCSYDLWLNKLATLSSVRMVFPHQLQLYRRHASNVTRNSVAANKKVLFPTLAALRTFGIKNCQKEWKDEIFLNNLFRDCLAKFKLHGEIIIFDLGKIDDAIRGLDRKNIAINKRIKLMEFRGVPRFFRVLSLYLNGFYQHFNGWKSAIKDIVR